MVHQPRQLGERSRPYMQPLLDCGKILLEIPPELLHSLHRNFLDEVALWWDRLSKIDQESVCQLLSREETILTPVHFELSDEPQPDGALSIESFIEQCT